MSAVARAAPRPYRLKALVTREHPLQRQVADVLRIEIAPAGHVSPHGVVWWAVDMANYAGVPGTRSARGIIAGVADFYILFRGQAHHPELKSDDGVLSEPQRWVASAVLCAGGKVAVVRNSDEMLEALDAWSIPRAHRVRMAERPMRVAGSAA